MEGKKIGVFEGRHEEGVYAVQVSKGEEFLLTGSGDSTILLWEIRTKRVLKKLSGHTS